MADALLPHPLDIVSNPHEHALTPGNAETWAWLDALARALDCTVLLVDAQGATALLVGTPVHAAVLRQHLEQHEYRRHLERLGSGERVRATIGTLLCRFRQLRVNGDVVGAMVVGVREQPTASSAAGRRAVDIDAIESWLAVSVEAHLGQRPLDEEEEAFDRISSLHRLLHDAVERGSHREVVTAFAEALFAWDGVECTGYIADVQGQWIRAMAPPGSGSPTMAQPGDLVERVFPGRLNRDELIRLGFAPDRHVMAIRINETMGEPWLLLFAEGYRALNLSRLNLYADLLREALSRVAAVVETRASWAILQALLGEVKDPEVAVTGALQEFARVLEGLFASLVVTNATGTVLLSAGDREASPPIRPFDRGNRLISTTHLPDFGTMQLTVRRARGQNFSRREQYLVERAASIFSSWLPSALQRPVEASASLRSFQEVLDRTAAQIAREGLDVSIVVIVVPDTNTAKSMVQSWVSQIRSRLRGTDLAGAISDREIGVLLSGTPHEYVPTVCARLTRSLGVDSEASVPPMGTATRTGGSTDDESIVSVARRNVNGRSGKRPSKRIGS